MGSTASIPREREMSAKGTDGRLCGGCPPDYPALELIRSRPIGRSFLDDLLAEIVLSDEARFL